jgi:hypothetical protein
MHDSKAFNETGSHVESGISHETWVMCLVIIKVIILKLIIQTKMESGLHLMTETTFIKKYK